MRPALLRERVRLLLGRAVGVPATLAVAFVLACPAPLLAQDAPRPQLEARTDATSDFGRLFDSVVATTAKNFWDKARLASIGWEKRAVEVRQRVVEAPNLEDAARQALDRSDAEAHAIEEHQTDHGALGSEHVRPELRHHLRAGGAPGSHQIARDAVEVEDRQPAGSQPAHHARFAAPDAAGDPHPQHGSPPGLTRSGWPPAPCSS